MTRTERGKRPRPVPFGARTQGSPFVAHARSVMWLTLIPYRPEKEASSDGE